MDFPNLPWRWVRKFWTFLCYKFHSSIHFYDSYLDVIEEMYEFRRWKTIFQYKFIIGILVLKAVQQLLLFLLQPGPLHQILLYDAFYVIVPRRAINIFPVLFACWVIYAKVQIYFRYRENWPLHSYLRQILIYHNTNLFSAKLYRGENVCYYVRNYFLRMAKWMQIILVSDCKCTQIRVHHKYRYLFFKLIIFHFRSRHNLHSFIISLQNCHFP